MSHYLQARPAARPTHARTKSESDTDESSLNSLLIKLQSIDPPTNDDDPAASQSEAGQNLWRALESSMVTLLTLTPGILDEVSFAKHSPSASSMLISVMSASSLLSSVTRTLIASVIEQPSKEHHERKHSTSMSTSFNRTGHGNHHHLHHHIPSPHWFRPVNNNNSMSAAAMGVHKKSDFALQKREQQVASSVANMIRTETEYILDQVQALRELVLQPQIFANATHSFDEYRQSIVHSLITHAHSLVDALLAFCASTSLVLVDKHLVHFASSLPGPPSSHNYNRKTPEFASRGPLKQHQHREQVLPVRAAKEPVSIYPAMSRSTSYMSASSHVRHPFQLESRNEGDTKLESASKKFFRGISIKSQQTTMVNMLHTSQGAGSAQQQQPDLTKMDMSRKRSKAKQTNAFKTFFGRKSSPQKDRQQQQQQSSRIKELFTLPKSTSTTSLHTDLKAHWKRPRAGSSSSSSQSLYQSDTGSVWQWQRGLEAEDCISYNEEAEEQEQEEDEEQEKEWAKIKDKQDERPQPIDDDDKPLISAGSFSGRRQQQRASVQMLASPFSRRTYIRMTDEGLGRFAVSLPEHEDTVCPMGLARTNGYAADQSIDSYSEEDEALEDEERPKSEASTSDSCYFSSSSSQATLTSESPVYPCDAHKSFLKPPQAGMQTVQEEERGYSHLKNENYRGKSPFAKEKEGLKHFRSESDLSRLQQQQTHTLAKTDEKPKAPPFKLAKTSKLKPPQRRHSVRSQLSIASRRSGGGHNSSDTRSIKEPGEQGSWSLLRAMRRNQSSANLKKEAEGRDMLRKAGLESSIVTSDFSDEKSMHGDTRILHVSENGCDVMVMEMVSGRLHVVAGTAEKLFLKLADETTQDLDFVDTYILCHVQFTTSMALLEDLIARFHLEAGPGETAYFEKWQHSIQVKVLSVLTRWVKLQYQDFDNAPILLARLEAFLNDDIKRAGFDTEVDMIREALDLQMAKHARRRHSLVALTSHAVVVPSNSSTPLPSGPGTLMSPATPSSSLPTPKFQQQRRPSGAPSLFSFVSSLSTPPSSPTSSNMSVAPASSYGSLSSATAPVVLLFEAGEIAQSLTLADFYIFKCITGYDYLQGNWRQESPSFRENDYIAMMTQRANRVSHWVLHEILSLKQLKQRRNALRKLIEVSRLCLEWNNFHTSMVITMSLASATLQKLQDTWQALSNKDMSTFQMLQKNLDVSNNMGAYRQAFASKAKAPAIPFFPLVLKDLTFYMDGNPTAVSETDMINFSKFRSMTKCVQSVLRNTDENYWFASDLDHLPFFPGSQDNPHAAGPLDGVADVIENRLHAVGCCHMDSQCESRLYNSLL